jgi:hypothetical protein
MRRLYMRIYESAHIWKMPLWKWPTSVYMHLRKSSSVYELSVYVHIQKHAYMDDAYMPSPF